MIVCGINFPTSEKLSSKDRTQVGPVMVTISIRMMPIFFHFFILASIQQTAEHEHALRLRTYRSEAVFLLLAMVG